MNLLDNKTSKMLIKVIPVIIIISLIIQFVIVSASVNPENLSNTIGITLEYASGTEFDADNDGIESLTGVIDFTVDSSEFNWEVDQEKLSTQWEVYSQESGETTMLCYGSEQTCNFIELDPSLENWSENFDLSYERYGATYNNTVSSRIIYVDYNLTPEDPSSEIYYSNKESLPAQFIEPQTETNTTNETTNITNTTAENITFSPVIKDASGKEVDIKLDIKDPQTGKLEKRYRKEAGHLASASADSKITSKKSFKIKKGKYNIDVEINGEHPIKKIEINDAELDENLTEFIRIDDTPEFDNYVEVYAIDPTAINFTEATVTVTATGTQLYKCKEWDFDNQECDGDWNLFKTGLIPGEEYTFTLTPDDPAFAETTEIRPTAFTDSGLGATNPTFAYDGNPATAATFSLDSNGQSIEYYPFTNALSGTITSLNVTFDMSVAGTSDDEWFLEYSDDGGITHYVLRATASGDLTRTNLTYVVIEQTAGTDGVWTYAEIQNNLRLHLHSDKQAGPDGATVSVYELYASAIAETVDNAPTITLNYPIDGFNTSLTSIEFNWTAIDDFDTSVLCNLTIDSVVNVSSINSTNGTGTNYTVNGFNDGTHTWNVTCNDSRGTANFSETRSFTVNTVAPNINLNYPPDGYNISLNYINFNWTATDDLSSSLNCNLTIDGVVNVSDIITPNGTSTNYTVSEFNDGTHEWNVSCVDDSLNTNTSETRNFVIDTTGPIVTIVNPKSKTYNHLLLGLYATAIDNGSNVDGCWYSLNNGINNSYACATNINITAIEGSNNLTVYANDTLGNTGYDNIQFDMNTSQILSISITSPANGTLFNDATPQLTLLAIDYNFTIINYTIYIYNETGGLFAVANSGTLNNNTPTNIILNPPLELIGDITLYKIVVVGNDGVYLANSSELTITILTPFLTLISPLDGAGDNDGNINFTFKYQDEHFPNLNCSILINGVYNQSNATTTENINTTFTLTGIEEGLNQNWTINCLNDVGINVSDTNYFHVDKTNPQLLDLRPISNSNYSVTDTIEISANVTDTGIGVDTILANITYPNSTLVQSTLNNAVGDKYNNTFTAPDLKGRYNVTFIATDVAGNINNTETTYFNVVNTYPNITTLNYPADNSQQNKTAVNFTFTAVEDYYNLTNCTLYTNFTGTFTAEKTIYNVTNNTSTNITANIADGTHIWNVLCYDNAGLSDWFTSNYTVTVSTQTKGLVVYSESAQSTPRNRLWNEFSYMGNEQAGAVDVSGDIKWAVTKANHERKEFILGTEDNQNDINVQVYNSDTKTWGNLLEVSTLVENSIYRSFDIAYEDTSGDALIVYEKNQTSDTTITYRIWNGTYSSEQTLTTGLTASPVRWVSLVSKQGSDNIMLLVHNSEADGSGDLYAIPWNGTGFESSKASALSTATASSTEQNFAFAWEESSGQGLVTYGEGTNIVRRIYTGSWGSPIGYGIGNGLDAVRMCSDPTSDYIGIILQDAGDNVNVLMWTGAAMLNTDFTAPTEDAVTEPSGTSNVNIDCTWHRTGGFALFGFIDSAASTIDYFNFTRAGDSWSTGDLTSTGTTVSFATSNIRGLRFTEHPRTNETMITALDTSNDISMLRWTGSEFATIAASPIEQNADGFNQEEAMFDWYRFDAVPIVVNITPAHNSQFSVSASVNISANVTDDYNISAVIANITLPDNSVQQLTLRDENSDSFYNATFTGTSSVGTYTIRIIANDTSTHKNVNSSVTYTFRVTDPNIPNVTALLPNVNSIFNVSNIIEVSANVTDDVAIHTVLANISYPNGTINLLTLSNSTAFPNKFNTSFTIPGLTGVYNITFLANDTSGNINNTGTTNFTVNDIDSLAITIVNCTPNPANISQVIGCNATITDDVAIHTVQANITMPNGTIIEQTVSNIASMYNLTFTTTTIPGMYNVTWWVNDTSNNIQIAADNFTINDVVPPTVTIDTPNEGSSFSQNADVSVTATVTDDVNVSWVYANFTLPDSSIIQKNLSDNNGDSVYNVTFSDTSQTGTYTIRVIANDSSNNINSTVTRTFDIQDIGTPLVTLVSPSNGATLTTITVNFTCNATDNSGLGNITLYHNVSGLFATNQTNDVNGTANETSFVINVSDGVFVWNCLANDTSGNTAFGAINYTLSIDTTPPIVTNLKPTVSSVYNVSNIINVSAKVTDNFGVSSILANISYPNGTINQLTLLDENSDNAYNTPFTAPALIGVYNITFIANDTSNNINASETTNFTVNDVDSLSITSLGCNITDANLSQHIQCNATITDDIGISAVQVNVTLPNGTILVQTTGNMSSNYYFNFTNTSKNVGQYNITWWVNDTSNNIQTTTASFNISDRIIPSVTLNAPANNSNLSVTSVTFNFTATDNFYSTLNCSLVLDGATNKTNAITQNGTPTLFTVNGLANGDHNWNVTCIDSSTNTNSSEVRVFTIDLDKPNFISLTTTPDTTDTDGLDPNVNIIASANVTDNTTAINTVIFQYKISTDSDYTNLTMNLDSLTGLYNTSFSVASEGTYNLRLFANDSAGNSESSSIVNIVVEFENTWTRTPSSFSPVTANINENVTLGNLIINNTGDYALNFTITSDSSTTIYNETATFTLAAKEIKVIQVNDSSPVYGTKDIILNISSNTSGVSPASQTTTATIVLAPGQPVLSTTFTTPSTDTKTVTQGDTTVKFAATLQNLGEGNASNVSFYFTIPDDWVLTFGSLNITFNQLLTGSSETNTIEVTIPSDATTGERNVFVNSTGVNASSVDLTSLGLTFGDKVVVTVNAPAAPLGPAAPAAPSAPAPSAGGGGGGGTSVRAPFRTIRGRELLETEETIEVIRGGDNTFRIKITNVYETAIMYEVRLDVEGYLVQYLKTTPKVINTILPGQTREFIVKITSPTYMEQDSHELVFTITGRLEGRSTIGEGDDQITIITKKTFVEKRLVTLLIREISREEVVKVLEKAEKDLADMIEAEFPVTQLEKLLEEARKALEEKDYKRVKELSEEISLMRAAAFEANKMIEDLTELIRLTEEKGINVDEAKKLLNLGMAAFLRGDFESALNRAKDAQLTQALLAKGKFNILWFLKTYWLAVLAVMLLLSVSGVIAQRKLAVVIIERRMEDLEKEETTINDLMKELQEKTYRTKEISIPEYHKQMYGHDKRLDEIGKSRTKLRSKRAGIIKASDEIVRLDNEDKEITEKIKQLQDNYYNKKTITRKHYERRKEEYGLRRVEIERAIAVLETKLAKKEMLQELEEKALPKKRKFKPKESLIQTKEEKKLDKEQNKAEAQRQVLVNRLNRWKIAGYKTSSLERLMKKQDSIKKTEILEGEDLVIGNLMYKLELWRKQGFKVEKMENMLNDYLKWNKRN